MYTNGSISNQINIFDPLNNFEPFILPIRFQTEHLFNEQLGYEYV